MRNRAQSVVPEYLPDAARTRDGDQCRFCGFVAVRYQEAVALTRAPQSPDDILTACVFCAQCCDLEAVSKQRSGLMIWLPEVPQTKLIAGLRELYMLRFTPDGRDRATKVLTALRNKESAPRTKAVERFGKDPLQGVVERLSSGGLSPREELGARLFNLDRLIIRADDLEFNKYPLILAFWRSHLGPIHVAGGTPALDELERLLAAA